MEETNKPLEMYIEIKDNQVKVKRYATITQGSFNSIRMNFTFPKEYDNLVKVAVFFVQGKEIKTAVLNNACYIPFEALKEGEIEFGVYAYDGEKLVFSPTQANMDVKKGSLPESEVIDPSSKGALFSPKRAKINVKPGSYPEEQSPDGGMSEYDKWLKEATKLYEEMLKLEQTMIETVVTEAYNKLIQSEEYKKIQKDLEEVKSFMNDNTFLVI